MSKNKIITTLFACAVGFSLLGAYLVWQFLSPQRGTMYVFNGDYSTGEQIKAEMLVPVQADATVFAGGKKTSASAWFVTPAEYDEVIHSGQSLREDVTEGLPLMRKMLSVSGGTTIEMNMRSDATVVTVPVDRYSGVTNDLKAGARVNVSVTMGGATILIQQNKRVLEVFRDEGKIVGVALEQDVPESLELIYALNNGKIYFSLVDATGYQSVEGDDPYYSFDSAAMLAAAEKPDQAAAYEDYLDSYASKHGVGAGAPAGGAEAETDASAGTAAETKATEEGADGADAADAADAAKGETEGTAPAQGGTLFEP